MRKLVYVLLVSLLPVLAYGASEDVPSDFRGGNVPNATTFQNDVTVQGNFTAQDISALSFNTIGTGNGQVSTNGTSMAIGVNGSTWTFNISSMTDPSNNFIAHATQTFVITCSSGIGWNGLTKLVMQSPRALTITKIVGCSLPAGSTVLWQIDERTSPGGAGTNVFSVSFSTASPSAVETTSFSNADIASGAFLVFTTHPSSGGAGNPTHFMATVYYLWKE
jgi:hypothetical protein